jgi:preprotein translocase subunit SecD
MKEKNKFKLKVLAIFLLVVFAFVLANPKETGIGWLDSFTEKFKINMGLDLQGGVHLVYQADMSNIESGQESEALNGIQDVIEKRVNAYGVAEPLIQTSKTGDDYRLIVELAGIKDIEEAKKTIKETPLLEFKEEGEPVQLTEEQIKEIEAENEKVKQKAQELLEKALAGEDFSQLAKDNSEDGSAQEGGDLGFFGRGVMVPVFEEAIFSENLGDGEIYPELVKSEFGYHVVKKIEQRGEGENLEIHAAHILLKTTDPQQLQQLMQPEFKDTGLTGQQLESAQVVFNGQTNLPEVSLKFNDEGKELFKNVTEKNVGKQVAIFLDGSIISAPVVQDVIRNGEAVINGKFTTQEARELAQRLNAGALPVPITLVSQQSVEATLGKASLEKSLKAGVIGLAMVAIFMLLYYRLAGLVAVLALLIYTALIIMILKISSLTPLSITLTLSGIAGFILSIGMAVDANILIFERMKEELNGGRDLKSAIEHGFRRAWPSIKDSNFSTILTALVLTLIGAGFVKGFALTLILGILLSMFTAIVITRAILDLITINWLEKHKAILLGGIKNNNNKN